MTPKYLDAEHNAFREALRTHIERHIKPHALKWEEARRIPREAWLELGKSGFLAPWIDSQYGGFGVDFGYSAIVREEMVRSGSSGLSEGLAVHADIAAPYIDRIGTPEQKARWLPGCVSGEIIAALGMSEPDAGSDVAGIRTTAARDGDNYIINGQKIFITNGMNCDVIILAVRTTAAGKTDARHGGVSLIVVEAGTPGFIKHRQLDKMGLHGQDTAELFFEDCRVPASNLLGVEGAGFKYLMQNLQRERLIVAIGCQAYSEWMLDKTVEYTKGRKAFGKPIASFQNSAFKIAEMATEVKIGRAFIDGLIDDFIEGKRDLTTEVSMAKWWTSDKANRIAYECVQLHGGYGYMREFEICRDYTDVRAMPIYAGANEIMKQIIARRMGIEV
ncbi:MAG TPA: acyl-CoA dehydrogenase family protein [Candidatus Binataceae bacterium]|nr:acyl-CoA dehydrogenase family protein [Candidatus Binataceae bacterium]